MISLRCNFQSVQLGFLRITISQRFSQLGKMMNRGIKSKPGAPPGVDSAIQPQNKTKHGTKKQLQSWIATDPAYENEWPSLLSSASDSNKSKRRTRIDLGTQFDQRSKKGAERLSLPQVEPSLRFNSASQSDGSPMLTSFGKKRQSFPSGRPHFCRTSHERRPHVRRTSCEGEVNAKTKKQPQSWIATGPAYENEWPLLLTSTSDSNKSKRRTRIDLGTQFEQRSKKGAERLSLPQVEPSLRFNSASQSDGSPMPTSFGKKRQSFPSGRPHFCRTSHEPRPHVRRTSHEGEVNAKNPMDDKPFDICFSQSQKQVVRLSLPENASTESIEMDPSIQENAVLRPGMVFLKSYIPLSTQVNIILRCRDLGLGTGGFYQPAYQDGAKLRLHMMCVGLDWDPQTKKYGSQRQHDNSEPPDIPPNFEMLVRRALDDSHALIKQQSRRSDVEEILPTISPDICIVNFYTTNGRLGLHQDRDESSESLRRGLPVVSFSIGDSAEFLYGDKRDIDKAERVLLESGDVLIFGGKSRHIFHGVASIIPKTAPPSLLEQTNLRPGRLNLTFRQY